jgi:transcriptional regulator with XRE-family HTH domain
MSFGSEVRRLREARAMSLRALADAVPCDPGYLSRVEAGSRQASQTMAAALDTALDAQGTLTMLERERGQGPQTRRRDVLEGMAAAGMVAAGWPLPGGDDLPRRVGTQHVTDVREATGMYRAWVARHGGLAVRAEVDRLLSRTCALHTAASESAVRSALLEAVADLAGLAGYIARDAAAHHDAEHAFRTALSAATACGNMALGGHTVVRMAGHGIELRRPDSVLTLLTVAQDQASATFSAGDRANQECIRAWAHAQAGNPQATLRAIGDAEELHARWQGEATGWAAQHVTDAELYSLTGAALVDLARRVPDYAEKAIDRLTTAIDQRGITAARNRTLDYASLAEALLINGEIDEAGTIACRAANARGDITSGRVNGRINDLRRQLKRHAAHSEPVATFLTMTRPPNERIRGD